MTTPAKYIQLHHEAMSQMDLHDMAMKKEQPIIIAKRHLWNAMRLENSAAKRAPKDLEPTRSVLHRSAAWLAFRAGETEQAKRLVKDGLQEGTPPGIKVEFAELLRLLEGYSQIEGKNA